MAEVCPLAQWRPLPRAMSTTPLRHDIICLHTMVGTLAGSWSWSSRAGGSYWHFGVGGGGAIWQCQDLRYRSAANLNGNWHVIPIETEDHGGYFPSWNGQCGNVPFWTERQKDAIVRLVAWLCLRYDIPPVLIPDTRVGRRGIAYHRQGIDPYRCGSCEKWSSAYGKCCPDNRRIGQLLNEVITRVQAIVGGGQSVEPKEWDEMASKEEIQQAVRSVVAEEVNRGVVLTTTALKGGIQKVTFAPEAGKPARFGYIIGSILIDEDGNGKPLVDAAGSAGAFDAVAGGYSNALQFDIVQAAVARAHWRLSGSQAALGRLNEINMRVAAIQNAVVPSEPSPE